MINQSLTIEFTCVHIVDNHRTDFKIPWFLKSGSYLSLAAAAAIESGQSWWSEPFQQIVRACESSIWEPGLDWNIWEIRPHSDKFHQVSELAGAGKHYIGAETVMNNEHLKITWEYFITLQKEGGDLLFWSYAKVE